MSGGGEVPVRTVDGGIAMRVRLTPGSSADRVEAIGADGATLNARVRAAPSEGAANDALIRLVAQWLGVAKSCVALTAGKKSRIKTVTVRGDPASLEQRVAAQLAQSAPGGGPAKQNTDKKRTGEKTHVGS